MNKPTVYLAGPIAGCNKGQANDWRKYVDEHLQKHNIVGVSPLRCEPLIGKKYELVYDDPKFGTPRAIKAKNSYDVRNCNMTIAYLPANIVEKRASWGTAWELGGIYFLGKPSIVVTDSEYLTKHPLVGGAADWCLDNLDDAIDVCVGILGGYNGGKNV